MNPYHRLHTLRMENDAAGYAMQEMRPRFDRMAGRHENGTAPRAVSAYQLFQTPPDLARRMADLLQPETRNPKPARILEPSAGLGRLLDSLTPAPRLLPPVLTAIEIAPQLCAELYRQERAGVTLMQRDFLAVTPAETGLFDAVIMNPPFHLRSDIRHILHARTFLQPGGHLAALCLDTHHRETALRHLCQEWIKIPETAFTQEGTRVPTVLLLMTI